MGERLMRWLRGPDLLRAALGLVYFHFGLLKFFPDLSPAELLAQQTILRMRMGIDPENVLTVLAAGECVLGLLLLFALWPRVTAVLLLLHLAGTFVPLFVLPEIAFRFAPFAPTLEGQYVLKNFVFVAAGLYLLAQPPRRGGAGDAVSDASYTP